MNEDTRVPYQISFARLWEARFMSHLDMMRAAMRLLRRSGLPIYFSEGFNPKPKISYRTMPLSSGHTSECERVIFQLMEETPDAEVGDAVAGAMPPGVALDELRRVSSAKKDENKPRGMEYYVYFAGGEQEMIARSFLEAVAEKNLAAGPLSMEQAARARIMARGDSKDFIERNFSRAVSVVVPVGNDYVRLDRLLGSIPGAAETIVHYHRRAETF